MYEILKATKHHHKSPNLDSENSEYWMTAPSKGTAIF